MLYIVRVRLQPKRPGFQPVISAIRSSLPDKSQEKQKVLYIIRIALLFQFQNVQLPAGRFLEPY
jgi:hypothetical protein